MSTLFHPLRNSPVHDLCVPGYIDRDGDHPRFSSWSRTAYLALDSGFLRLDSTRASAQLSVQLVPKIDIPIEIAEEDDEFATFSYWMTFLADDRDSLRVTKIRYTLDSTSDLDQGALACAEFEFQNGHVVFFDPFQHFGIKIGGKGQYEAWMEEKESLIDRGVNIALPSRHVWMND